MHPRIGKPLLALAIVVLAALALGSLPAVAAASDRDCSDFATQRAAQIFFLKHGGPRHDPHRLDGDHDGIACEDNPCPCYYRKRLPRRQALRWTSVAVAWSRGRTTIWSTLTWEGWTTAQRTHSATSAALSGVIPS